MIYDSTATVLLVNQRYVPHLPYRVQSTSQVIVSNPLIGLSPRWKEGMHIAVLSMHVGMILTEKQDQRKRKKESWGLKSLKS